MSTSQDNPESIRFGHHLVRFNPEILSWQVVDLRVHPTGLVINANGKGHAISMAKRRERDAAASDAGEAS